MYTLSISRRRFLESGIALSLGIPEVVFRGAAAAGARHRTLVCIQLEGGNDSLNMIVPYTDSLYYDCRPGIAVDRGAVLPLSAGQGLNPVMRQLSDLYADSKVAVVNGIGYPDFDYSHFRAEEIYAQGDPSRSRDWGWLGRSIEQLVARNTAAGQVTDVLSAVHIGASVAPSLASTFPPVLLPPDLAGYYLVTPDRYIGSPMIDVLSQQVGKTNRLLGAVAENNRTTLQAYSTVRAASKLRSLVDYSGKSTLTTSLQLAAKLIRKDPYLRVITTSQPGYDTHEDQPARQNALLKELSSALFSFWSDLQQGGLSQNVIVLVWSEFGRRVEANGCGGTDHGAAQSILLIGDGVQPGIHGEPPSLRGADLVGSGNLAMQYDFRRLYAAILTWLGFDVQDVLKGEWSPLPVLRS